MLLSIASEEIANFKYKRQQMQNSTTSATTLLDAMDQIDTARISAGYNCCNFHMDCWNSRVDSSRMDSTYQKDTAYLENKIPHRHTENYRLPAPRSSARSKPCLGRFRYKRTIARNTIHRGRSNTRHAHIRRAASSKPQLHLLPGIGPGRRIPILWRMQALIEISAKE